MPQYVTSRVASDKLGLHPNTLRKLADNNQIDFIKISSQRRYNIEKYIKDNHTEEYSLEEEGTENICYCRVSSRKQLSDLKNQEKFLKKKFPKYTIISDVGSGINFKRPGLLKILDKAQQGSIKTVVVAHKDRLARIAFDLIEHLIQKNGGKVLVLSKNEISEEEEFVQDVIGIITVFGAKFYGTRNYQSKSDKIIPKNKRNKKEQENSDSESE